MRIKGRYYLKHTINHMVSNSSRAKKANTSYSTFSQQSSINDKEYDVSMYIFGSSIAIGLIILFIFLLKSCITDLY